MKTYNVTIEEVISETFEIEANSPEEAREIAEEQYWNAELIVGPNVTQRQMQVEDGEWEEF